MPVPTIAPTPSAIRCGQLRVGVQPVLGRHVLGGDDRLLRIPARHGVPSLASARILVRLGGGGKRGRSATVDAPATISADSIAGRTELSTLILVKIAAMGATVISPSRSRAGLHEPPSPRPRKRSSDWRWRRRVEGESELHAVLETQPAPIYTTDADGWVTFYNRACIDFAGRTPVVGEDRWCVTWRLYSEDGGPLPHERLPDGGGDHGKARGARRRRLRRAARRHAGDVHALSDPAARRCRATLPARSTS